MELNRYLTAEAKRSEIAAFEETKNREGFTKVGQGGLGFVDSEVAIWCDKLNRIQGICTLQSCSGHADRGYISSGHLWLWLSHDLRDKFGRKARLAKNPLMESVSCLYSRWGQEIIEIYFAGKATDDLDRSMRAIEEFFIGFRCYLLHSPR